MKIEIPKRSQTAIVVVFSLVMGFELALAAFGALSAILMVVHVPEFVKTAIPMISLPGIIASGCIFWFIKSQMDMEKHD